MPEFQPDFDGFVHTREHHRIPMQRSEQWGFDGETYFRKANLPFLSDSYSTPTFKQYFFRYFGPSIGAIGGFAIACAVALVVYPLGYVAVNLVVTPEKLLSSNKPFVQKVEAREMVRQRGDAEVYYLEIKPHGEPVKDKKIAAVMAGRNTRFEVVLPSEYGGKLEEWASYWRTGNPGVIINSGKKKISDIWREDDSVLVISTAMNGYGRSIGDRENPFGYAKTRNAGARNAIEQNDTLFVMVKPPELREYGPWYVRLFTSEDTTKLTYKQMEDMRTREAGAAKQKKAVVIEKEKRRMAEEAEKANQIEMKRWLEEIAGYYGHMTAQEVVALFGNQEVLYLTAVRKNGDEQFFCFSQSLFEEVTDSALETSNAKFRGEMKYKRSRILDLWQPGDIVTVVSQDLEFLRQHGNDKAKYVFSVSDNILVVPHDDYYVNYSKIRQRK